MRQSPSRWQDLALECWDAAAGRALGSPDGRWGVMSRNGPLLSIMLERAAFVLHVKCLVNGSCFRPDGCSFKALRPGTHAMSSGMLCSTSPVGQKLWEMPKIL